MVQQLDLHAETLERVSPKAWYFWQESQLPGHQPTSGTLSLYPWSTRQQLAALAIPTIVFGICIFLPHGHQCVYLCGAIAANGALFSLFGIAQRLTYNGKIYWYIPLSQGGHPFAAFVNQNNAGGYLNLCLAAAVGWFLSSLPESNSAEDDWKTDDWKTSGRHRQWSAATFWAFACIVVILAGILFTFSRGAILSLFVSGTVLLLALVADYGLRNVAKIGIAIGVVGLGLFVWMGQSHRLVERWDETLGELQTRNVSRFSHWQDALGAARDFPLTGTGLGYLPLRLPTV